MKKALEFFGLFLSFIGAGGGVGASIYHGDYVIAAGVCVLAGAAFPTLRNWFQDLTA